MIMELDTVVLTTELPAHSLKAGDLGTMVLAHRHGGYEVEFLMLTDFCSVHATRRRSSSARTASPWYFSLR